MGCGAMVRAMGLVLVSFARTDASAQGRDANSVPPNYRELIVRRILESTDPRSIRRARISEPHEQWAGLFSGGNQPTICVEVIRETILTSNARDVWAFTFQDGRIATATYSNANCGDYSPFNELLQRR
jgi:hypothetical protein